MQLLIIFSSLILWILVIFNLLITLQLIRIIAPDVWMRNSPKLKIGLLAPKFAAELSNGESVGLSTFLGQPLLLVFISLQCSSCLEKLSDLQNLEPIIKRIGIRLYLVCDADRHKVQILTNEFGITLPVLLAEKSNPIWREYKVNGIPFYCFIDERSRVQATGLFDSGWDALTKVWKINSD
jgi:peroxiredoxin